MSMTFTPPTIFNSIKCTEFSFLSFSCLLPYFTLAYSFSIDRISFRLNYTGGKSYFRKSPFLPHFFIFSISFAFINIISGYLLFFSVGCLYTHLIRTITFVIWIERCSIIHYTQSETVRLLWRKIKIYEEISNIGWDNNWDVSACDVIIVPCSGDMTGKEKQKIINEKFVLISERVFYRLFSSARRRNVIVPLPFCLFLFTW